MSKLDTQPLFRHPEVVVASCKFGYGVFATADIPDEAMVEECPYLRIKGEHFSGIVDDYVYHLEPEEGESGEESAYYSLPLGSGCIFNHSDDNNIEYWHDIERKLIVFRTNKDVHAGEQLFVNYGKSWWEERDLTPENDE